MKDTKYLEKLLEITRKEKNTAINNHEYEKAADFRTTEKKLLAMIEDTKMTLNELKDKAAKFSDKTFGVEIPVHGPMNHMYEEIDEVIECLDPLDEFADIFLMLVDAFRKYYGNDVDMQKLIDASSNKLDVNATRKWGEPDENGVIKHIKE